MRSLLVVLLSMACLAERAARAESDPADAEGERRDGCPAGIRRGSKSTEPADLGVAPELDSALASSNVTLAARGSYFTANGGSDPSEAGSFPRTRLLTEILQFHLNAPFRHSWRGLFLHETFSASLASVHRWHDTSPEIEARTLMGNFVLARGLRLNWLSSFDHAKDKEIAGIRNAAAIQVFIGAPTGDDTHLRQELASKALFDDYLFRPGLPWGISAEYRVEMVGCYAPFVHIRADLRREDIGDTAGEDMATVIPVSAAVGMAVSDDAVLFIQYAFIHFSKLGIFNVNAYHRLRIGIDTYLGAGFHGAAGLDAFTGNYDGMFLGLSISRELGGDRFR